MPSPAPHANQNTQAVPLIMVGGTKFGRYNKISDEQTWNMIVSDDWLVPYAGYKNVLTTATQAPGRGLYSSYRGQIMIAIFGNSVFSISTSLQATDIGTLQTTKGDVYIAENNNSEIAITDGQLIYVYNYSTGTFLTSTMSTPVAGVSFSFPYQNPGYISFQNGRLIVVSNGTKLWALSKINQATVWEGTGTFVGEISLKPDFAQAAVPMPGGGNNLLVLGRNVAELWQDIGATLFPYQRSSTLNADYGCLNASTVASLNNFIVWLGVNEQSGPTIMVWNGRDITQITTDGIDYKMGNLVEPTNCTAFLFQQDGHLIYQFTFITDNLTYCYDFSSKLFFSLSDENMNYHPAREVVYFNNSYYFVSLNGGNIYLFDTVLENFQYSAIDIKEIPRIRITAPARQPSQRMLIIKSAGFTIENGEPNEFQIPTSSGYMLTELTGSRMLTEDGLNEMITEFPVFSLGEEDLQSGVDLSISRDGGENFGSSYRLWMNPTGKRRSRFIYQRLGQANDATFQFRFWGFKRFLCTNGEIELYE